jgi:hypothetical protein
LDGAIVLNALGGQMTLLNSTFAENTTLGTRGPVSVIAGFSGATTLLQNTIVVHNSEDTSVQDCAGVVTSLGNNVIGDPFACGMAIQLMIGSATRDWTSSMMAPQEMRISNCYPTVKPSMRRTTQRVRRKIKSDQARKPQCDIGAVEFDRRLSTD